MRSWVSLRSAFIAVVAWSGSGLLGLHKVSHALLGWEKWQTFAAVIPIILIYVLLSGYMGVVVSDLIQAIVMIAASLVLMVIVLADFGGPAGLYSALVEKFGTGVVSWHPPTSHELLGVMGVIAWTVGTAIGYGGDVAPMAGAMEGQRLLSCRNAKEASKMYIWTAVVLFFMLAVLTLPALGAMVKWPGLYDGSINKELAYGMLLGHYLPTGLLGLAIVAILASIMSTIDSNLNFGSQVFLNDVYRRSLVKKASTRHYMNVGRVVMFVIMGLAVLVATKAENVIDISVFMLGLSSAEITANWGQWWWWRFNGKARLAASFGGPIIFLLNKFVVFEYLIKPDSNTTYIVVLLSMAMTCLLWIVVALLTKPDPEEKLVQFYKLARPLGWWGPIALKATGRAPVYHHRPIITGLLVATLGMIMVSSGVIALSCLYIGRWVVAAIAMSICIITGIVFKISYSKFMKFIGVQEQQHKRQISTI
jgi:Na+/proline symporter